MCEANCVTHTHTQLGLNNWSKLLHYCVTYIHTHTHAHIHNYVLMNQVKILASNNFLEPYYNDQKVIKPTHMWQSKYWTPLQKVGEEEAIIFSFIAIN